MTVKEAYKKINAVVAEGMKELEALGLFVTGRMYYNDKNLFELTEYTPKCILLFGSMRVGFEDMEEDELCGYAVSVEIKTGEVGEDELNESVAFFKKELDGLKERIGSTDNANERRRILKTIYDEQSKEIAEATEQFNKEIKKVRLKMTLAIAVLVVICVAILVLTPLLGK